MRNFIFTFLLLASMSAQAITDKSIYIGASYFSHGILRVAATETGEAGLLGPSYYPLTLQTAFTLGNGWSIAPQVGYTLFGTEIFPKVSPDGGQKYSYLFFNLPFVKSMGGKGDSGFEWGIGPGMLFYSIKGTGGSAVLNNGTTQTVFGQPDGTKTSRTITLNLGLGYCMDNFRFNLDTILEGVLTNKRTFSLLLNISYNFLGK